jgi:hypothetical protein
MTDGCMRQCRSNGIPDATRVYNVGSLKCHKQSVTVANDSSNTGPGPDMHHTRAKTPIIPVRCFYKGM